MWKKPSTGQRAVCCSCTPVYSLPGMNNKKAGTVVWGVCGCVYTSECMCD